ncbi:serine/threonine-protein phosphatase 6 regulatory subunit 3-like [Macrosteles quadrilineatus]|uniref:serine/threonine-protein phosphatase 6 regulatory subunit 3-like n=1 Tax=Macrosteles quadrilineatus TaxID=74068 RepID=UPI0023E2C21D|nr:serine/threonine-protein phosphatase 6 regulatory subunit 3-like [Macrosteles quadrilineatus]
MFWNYNQSSSPQIDNVFCKEDLTLQELLDQENILQELKSQNKKLIEFLVKPEVLFELVTLIVTEPPEELPEAERYKHSNIACELLTTDIPSFTENLVKDATLLAKLYSFLETDPPLNPLLASFFSRTMGVLVARRTEQNWYSYQFTCLQVLEFLKTKEGSVSMLLKHLGTSAIMDLTLKLVTQVEGDEMKLNILNFLAAQGLVEMLIESLSPEAEPSSNFNAALLLSDIIIKSRESGFENKSELDPILSCLESSETIKKILEVMFSGGRKESSLIGGIAVLLTLLEPIKLVGAGSLDSGGLALNYGGEGGGGGAPGESPAPSPPPPVTLSTTEAIIPYLTQFHDLLLNPPQKPAVKMTCGQVDPPLGNTRLNVIKLLVALIATHNQQVAEQLVALDTIQVLLDMFFRYSWNNFLHTQVEKCLTTAMLVDPSPTDVPADNLLLHNIFIKCRLLNRIIEAWKENEVEQSKQGGCRKGYMGHLTRLSFTINSYWDKGLGTFIKTNVPEDQLTAWQEFTDGELAEIKAQREIPLGGKHPAQSTSEDDEKNFRNIPFQQDTQLQQLYTEYQTQQMSSQFIENFGYHESEFNDPEDNMGPSVDRLANLSFSVTDDEELEKQAEMFQQVCSRRLQFLDGDNEDNEEDVWADTNNGPPRVWNGGEEIANYNSSDDEERPGPEGREEAHMDIDTADPWASLASAVSLPVEGPANPWGDGESTPAEEVGWANFDTNFSATFDSNSTSTQAVEQVASSNELSSVMVVSAESRSEPLGASSTEESEPDKKDDNANVSLSAGDSKSIDKEQLIDNFRFLSSQGLIADKPESSPSTELYPSTELSPSTSTTEDVTSNPCDSSAGQDVSEDVADSPAPPASAVEPV